MYKPPINHDLKVPKLVPQSCASPPVPIGSRPSCQGRGGGRCATFCRCGGLVDWDPMGSPIGRCPKYLGKAGKDMGKTSSKSPGNFRKTSNLRGGLTKKQSWPTNRRLKTVWLILGKDWGILPYFITIYNNPLIFRWFNVVNPSFCWSNHHFGPWSPTPKPPAFLGAAETAGTASAAEAAATVLPKVQPGPGCL